MTTDHEYLCKLIGSRLKNKRLESRMTQLQLAKHVNLSRTSIVNIEAGNQSPPLHHLYEICKVLGAEVVDVLPKFDEIVQSPTALATNIAKKMGSSGGALTAGAIQEIMTLTPINSEDQHVQGQGTQRSKENLG